MDIDLDTPTTIGEEVLAPGDPRTTFAGAVTTARAVMAAVTPEQWDLVTPCGMTVRELLEHLVMVMRRVELAGRFVPTAEWPMDAADVPDGGWAAAFAEAAHATQAAWTTQRLDEPRELPWGVFGGSEVLGVYTNELTVHTWDLATATGQDVEWIDEVLVVSLHALHQQLPLAERGPIWEAARSGLPADYPWTDPFADAVPVPDDAPLIDQVVAWAGRNPGR